MFDAIAARYDLLNHLLSAGLDYYWRQRAVRALELTGRETLLDLCTGTGDVGLAALRAGAHGAARVVGIDFAHQMLRLGLAKVQKAGKQPVMRVLRGDALRLPVGDARVDAASIAFGIRNVENPQQACREVHRVLRPGGRFAILEFSLPRALLIRRLYAWYFQVVLPRIGRLISRHHEAYEYLPVSVHEFASPERFVHLLEQENFANVKADRLTFGIVYLYTGAKPR